MTKCEKKLTLRKSLDCMLAQMLTLFGIVVLIAVLFSYTPDVKTYFKSIVPVRLEQCNRGSIDCIWQNRPHKVCSDSFN